MICRDSIKILDRKDIEYPFEYEEEYKLRFFVEDKGMEEEKIKDDLLHNVLKINKIFKRPHKLGFSYNSCKFIEYKSNIREILSENRERNYNYLFKELDGLTISVDTAIVFSKARKIWNHKNVERIIFISTLIISYLIPKYYLHYKEINTLLDNLIEFNIILNYEFMNSYNTVIVYTNIPSEFIEMDYADPTVLNEEMYSIIDHEYFEDLDNVLNKLFYKY